MRSLTSGAMTVIWAFAACKDSILDSARCPAPMTMQGRPASLRKIGKSDIGSSFDDSGGTQALWLSASRIIRYDRMLLARSEASGAHWRRIALFGIDDGTVEQCAEGVVVIAGEVGAEVFFGLAVGEVGEQQAL